MNKCLESLDLAYIHLANDDILLLADSLHVHPKLSELSLCGCNAFQQNLFTEFLQRVFKSSSRSRLSILHVDDLQYDSVKHQLEIYQAICQQKCLPKTDLVIVNDDNKITPMAMSERRAVDSLNKNLLTGE